ncbi:cyclase family protein [Maritimibacter dapengensis]|uniref:Cyclase family protein n=1 Tax=Maritimibacter dapengensis TaxID=2836868 RepID=A0ABS6T5Y4_9RHOB|nr:cyclase family protein [Maritimibacter dapengensis]MBV7380600.1 cyclase family protein [Maritimibacter dapengensis]
MPRKIVDLSVPLMAGIASDPPGMTPEIEFVGHDAGARTFEAAFGIPVDKQLEGKGAAIENLRMTTHSGTHMDAPWHYHPTMNGGEPAWRIDQVPLEWCMGPGVKLDFRSFPDGHVVTPDEVEAELLRIGHDLQPGDIVLVNTRAGGRYGEDDYVSAGCGMGREATLWLTERGMRVCGTDAWSWDAPLMSQMERIQETGDWSLFWEGHKAGRDTIYCHIEKLGNLEAIPSTGFEVVAMPMNIKDASAGFVRPIALIDT